MTYEQALAMIATEFELLGHAPHYRLIRTGLAYDGCNGFCVAIYNDNGELILTDLGETKEVFDEISKEEWEMLCEAHGFRFRHWHIESPFEKMDDLYAFIQFLDMISDQLFLYDSDD